MIRRLSNSSPGRFRHAMVLPSHRPTLQTAGRPCRFDVTGRCESVRGEGGQREHLPTNMALNDRLYHRLQTVSNDTVIDRRPSTRWRQPRCVAVELDTCDPERGGGERLIASGIRGRVYVLVLPSPRASVVGPHQARNRRHGQGRWAGLEDCAREIGPWHQGIRRLRWPRPEVTNYERTAAWVLSGSQILMWRVSGITNRQMRKHTAGTATG